MSELGDAIERTQRDERRRALRALLMEPLLGARHEAFPLVRRHGAWLRDWFGRETGWGLQVESDFARLAKRPVDRRDTTRPARSETSGASLPFSRRRYAILCLALAELERGGGQTTLGSLGLALVEAAADPGLAAAGLRFTLAEREERRDLVAVVRLLLALGVLARVAGDEEAYIQQGKDVLYDLNRRLLAALLVTRRGPSMVEMNRPLPDLEARLAAVTESFVPDSPEARNRALRQSLTARLLDDPVVYWEELSDEERAYFTSQRAQIVGRLQEAVGLVAELRLEGIAMVDPEGELTDERMPSEGTEGHATLLLAEHLAHSGALAPTLEELERQMRHWSGRFAAYWRKSAREPGAERELCRQAIDRLCALRLVTRDGDRIRPLPALARFALAEPTGAEAEELPNFSSNPPAAPRRTTAR